MRAERAGTRVVTREDALARAAAWRRAGERVALADGAFDLLRAEHSRWLAALATGGSRLVVAVRADEAASVGDEARVVAAAERAALVAALRGVDAVVVLGAGELEPFVAALAPEKRASEPLSGGAAELRRRARERA